MLFFYYCFQNVSYTQASPEVKCCFESYYSCKHAQKLSMRSFQKSKFTHEIFIYHSVNKHRKQQMKKTEWNRQMRQYCNFSEVVKLKRLWLCICCWKHKDHMCALYPWWILLDDSCGLCKRVTLCCSPAAALACEDSPHWLQHPTLFSLSPQHGNTDALSCKHRSRLQILQNSQ